MNWLFLKRKANTLGTLPLQAVRIRHCGYSLPPRQSYPNEARYSTMSTNNGWLDQEFIGAIDEGTTSARFFVFDKDGQVVSSASRALPIRVPRPGWAEQDPVNIYAAVLECIQQVVLDLQAKLGSAFEPAKHIKTVGITNQRETIVAWDRESGEPLAPAILWLDTRTRDLIDNELLPHIPNRALNYFIEKCGTLLSTYFTGVKALWLLKHCKAVAEAARNDTILFGTIDTWLLYVQKLTKGNVFATDVTNGSRTMLMNIRSLEWDSELLNFFNIKPRWLPKIQPSLSNLGSIEDGPLSGVPISAVLGDQQASLFGHGCLERGATKATYGTGCFILTNTGSKLIIKDPLVSTVAYQASSSNKPPVFAIEAPIAAAGSAINWLKDDLELFTNWQDLEKMVSLIPTSQGVLFVPALSGLLCPHWNDGVKGAFLGLSLATKRPHFVRAVLESIAYSCKEAIDCMEMELGKDSCITKIVVDGGLTNSAFLMQFQADLLQKPIHVAPMVDTTVFGVALAAATQMGLWTRLRNHGCNSSNLKTYVPSTIGYKEKLAQYEQWKKAVALVSQFSQP